MEASRQVAICAIASRLKIIVTWLKFYMSIWKGIIFNI